jgi:hypothetical protein
MKENIGRKVTYFKYCGEVNTEKVLQAVKLRCRESGIHKVVIASETGKSALKALDILKQTDAKMIVVTHYPATTWGPKGDIPIGLKREEYAKNQKKLEENGVKIVQGTRPFAPPSRSINWGYPTLECIIDKTLEIFGAGTYKGLDTALVVKTAHSGGFFREFEVREIIAKPISRVKSLPEYKFKNWKGNLDDYYP